MTVNLPPEFEQLVASKVADGTYRSEEDVLRAALTLLVEHDDERRARVERLRAMAAEGFAQLDAGLGSRVTADDIKRAARERFLG